MKFKIGDKIICKDSTGNSHIKRGRTYTVTFIDEKGLRVEEGGHLSFWLWRFELAKEHMFDSLYLRLKE